MPIRQRGVPTSVRVLRGGGPMDLRTVARKTADAHGFGSIMYADVDAVLEAAAERGEVRIKTDAEDYRERVWEAVGG